MTLSTKFIIVFLATASLGVTGARIKARPYSLHKAEVSGPSPASTPLTEVSLSEVEEMQGPPGRALGPVLSNIPEWAAIVGQAHQLAVERVSLAATRLSDPNVANIVLRQWLGLANPTTDTTPLVNGNGQVKIPALFNNSTRMTQQQYIVKLCQGATFILENAVVEHGTQDAENNDCISNPVNAEPYAYVKRHINGGMKNERYHIFLCSHAFVEGNAVRLFHHYNTMVEQIASLLVHEAFHHTTNPVIEDRPDCLGKIPALWCGKCHPEMAQNNGFNYQHVVAHAIEDPTALGFVRDTSSLNCAVKPMPSETYFQDVQAEARTHGYALAMARAKVRGVLAQLMDKEAAQVQQQGALKAAEYHSITEMAKQTRIMESYFVTQANAFSRGDMQGAANAMGAARDLYKSMKAPKPAKPQMVSGPVNYVPMPVTTVYKTYRPVAPQPNRVIVLPPRVVRYAPGVRYVVG